MLNNYTNERILGSTWLGVAKVIYDCPKTFKLFVLMQGLILKESKLHGYITFK